jgi:uncharacterized Zn-binding protein involved in type VI secretion
MRDAENRGVVRLGDRTDHGGQVKTALPTMVVHGIPVAGEDCLASCPKCKGDFRILRSRSARMHMGKALAYNGDLTECGAKLISSFRG